LPQAFLLSRVLQDEIVEISTMQRKAKTLYVNMLNYQFLYPISLGFGEKLVCKPMSN